MGSQLGLSVMPRTHSYSRPSVRAVAVLFAVALVHPQRAAAQLTAADIHARVTEFLATRSPRPLPAGDTLVSWNADHPVLFHTGSRDANGATAGMLRADRMFGWADVRWRGGRPRGFVVQWITPGSTAVDTLNVWGTVEGTGMRISRSHKPDTVLTTPNGSWAVADYGMEELLVPAFEAANESPSDLAVLRPYALKWDTLRVSAGPNANGWRVVRWTLRDSSAWSAVLQGSHLLWVRRSDHPDNEKIALEGTALQAGLESIRAQVEPASRPARHNER